MKQIQTGDKEAGHSKKGEVNTKNSMNARWNERLSKYKRKTCVKILIRNKTKQETKNGQRQT
jgi:hypothetical protein